MKIEPHRRLDLRDKHCPYTVMEVGKALRELDPGGVLEVVLGTEAGIEEVQAWCKGTGTVFIGAEVEEGVRVYLRRA
jgi:TusA-related sulfurtransferase